MDGHIDDPGIWCSNCLDSYFASLKPPVSPTTLPIGSLLSAIARMPNQFVEVRWSPGQGRVAGLTIRHMRRIAGHLFGDLGLCFSVFRSRDGRTAYFMTEDIASMVEMYFPRSQDDEVCYPTPVWWPKSSTFSI